MSDVNLTVRQQLVVGAIRAHWQAHGFAPTFREIARETGIGSTSLVAFYLAQLRRLGLVGYADGLPRTVRVLTPTNGREG